VVRTEVTGRRGLRRKQMLDDLKGKMGYWKLKKETLISLCEEPALERNPEPLIHWNKKKVMRLKCS
jgi:hypothetical protein